MTTIASTTAATQAGVTVATIRTWCRTGVIAAVKSAGRWVIDTASLAHRITIGTWRTRVTTPAPGTMAARGQDYVASWPAGIAAKNRLSPEYIAEALVRAGFATPAEQTDLRTKFRRGEAAPQIAALTPDNARLVIAELRAISSEITEAAKKYCECSALKVRGADHCPSCGTEI